MNQKIKVEDDDTWGKVLLKAGQDFQMKRTPSCQITLLITNPLKKGFRCYEESNAKPSQLFSYSMSKKLIILGFLLFFL